MRDRCLSTIILFTAAAAVLPLAFGQTPSSPGNGDVFNSTTINIQCMQVYTQTGQGINDSRLRMESQMRRAEAACKDQHCVSGVQQQRIAQEQVFQKQIQGAKDQLNSCETKPGSGTAAPGNNAAQAPVFLKGGIEQNVNLYGKPGYPDPATIQPPVLKSGTQDTGPTDKGQPPIAKPQPLKGFEGEVPGYGTVTVFPGSFTPGQTITVAIKPGPPQNGRITNVKTAWGYVDSGKFYVTKIEDLKGNVITLDTPVALPRLPTL